MTAQSATPCKVGQAGADVEVSPEMTEAGVYEMRECVYGLDLSDVVEKVYRAMEHERRDQSGRAIASESICSK